MGKTKRTIGADELVTILSLVDKLVHPLEVQEAWDDGMRQKALDWAAATHAKASDNIVRVPPCPRFVASLPPVAVFMPGNSPFQGCQTAREPTIHVLKELPHFYEQVVDYVKLAELRKDDRPGGFQVGDVLRLRWYDANRLPWDARYNGREVYARVLHKLADYDGLMPGYCMLSIERLKVVEAPTAPAVVAERTGVEHITLLGG